MENAITLNTYLTLTGIVVAAISVVVGYWINEIARVKKALGSHVKADETEFYKAQRENDTEHAKLRQEIAEARAESMKNVLSMQGDIKLLAQKVDQVLEIVKTTKI